MKKIAILLVLALCLSSFVGCVEEQAKTSSFFMMDTVITVTLYGTDEGTSQEIFAQCRAILTELENLWSRTKEESDISRFNAAREGTVTLDERTVSLLHLARAVQVHTNGAFDVSLAPVCDLWQRCGAENRLPTDAELAELLSLAGEEGWSLLEGGVEKHNADTALDLGGIGKGAAADALIAYLKTTEASGGMVSFGSNVAVFGEKPDGEAFRIAVKDPKNTSQHLTVLSISANDALSVSGDYERFVEIGGEKYHHVIDPKTGYPSRSGLSSVAIVCEGGALADALSTACLVLGYDGAMELYARDVYDFEALFVFSDGTVKATDGLLLQSSAA